MNKVCVFAGTTEGRKLVEFLSVQPICVTACVATEYGESLLAPADNLTISACRLTEGEIQALLRAERFDLVVDATHPYATAVTENIATACSSAGTPYLRLLRSCSAAPEGAVFVPDTFHAVEYLNHTEGNILLTTGSKELSFYKSISGFSKRAYARVLPVDTSLVACQDVGLAPSHIIAMQGPFSSQMNAVMLRATGAKYLVTKEGDAPSGFAEKVTAAEETGATLVVVGRPPQREGLSLSDMVGLLCRRFGLPWRPRGTVAGIGPGCNELMTREVWQAIQDADCLIGAERMLAAARPGQPVFAAIRPETIVEYIREHREFHSFTVVMSGDMGFFSGTKKLLPLLTDCQVEVLPGISSLSYFCARLGISYEDVVPISAHGRAVAIAPILRVGRGAFVLVSGEDGVASLCHRLTEAGMGSVSVTVGERLSYPDERITSGTAEELTEESFSPLSAVLVQGPGTAAVPCGLPDEAFLRGGGRTDVVPMTKSEIRAVCLSKLQLPEDAVCWDIGAGTGSVSIEMALQAWRGQVYAVECREDALELLRENRHRFGAENLKIVPGTAPEACSSLPPPTHAFIGGSSGNLREIIYLLREKNPQVRVVATAVTLESISELTSIVKELSFANTDYEVISLTVAKDNITGGYHLMRGQNPVYIFSI